MTRYQLLPKLIALTSFSLLLGCADPENEGRVCIPNTFDCSANTLLRCTADGTGYEVDTDCAAQSKFCIPTGCVTCQPGTRLCQGTDIVQCNDKGTGYLPNPVLRCDISKAEICHNLACINACKLARQNRSYVGCEYWAVDLDNAVVTSGSAASQQFAVVLSNPSALPAAVTVTINEANYGETAKVKTVTTRTIKPQAMELLLLPAREVDGSPAGKFNAGGGTAVTPNAYRIDSTAPIIAYQFNPLSNVGVFSNDASLLVPTQALTIDYANETGADYLVMGWPQTIATTSDPKTNFGTDLRAFLSVVGTRAGTEVKISLTTATIADKAGKVAAQKKGDLLSFKLEPYEVLNLETGDFAADFTGTRISTNKPVVVFSGSEASDVPDFLDLTTRKCCADHLEHQLFPLSTFGKVFIALTTPPRTAALYAAGATITVKKQETEYFRVLSAGEFASVSTNLSDETSFIVDYGKYKQLKVTQDFTLTASKPIALGQFVSSQGEVGIPSSLPGGDPSFILLPPVEQFRKDYLFLTPNKYAFDFIMVAAPQGAKITLDGRELKSGCDSTKGKKLCCTKSDVGKVLRPKEKVETHYDAYKCQLSFPTIKPGQTPPDNLAEGEQNDGVHRLVSNQPVGLVVYGFDAYVSYGYPGGTDLELINVR